jgi:hypothetical protein
MTSPSENKSGIEMPAPTTWPMTLALGLTLLAVGLATHFVLSLVGVGIFVVGLAGWIGQLLPGQGHVLESAGGPGERPGDIVPRPGTVETILPGQPGHRLSLPLKVHPYSAGLKGGVVGGLLMPIPALIYSLASGHGLWWPVNLLAGMVLPSMDAMTVPELEQFHLSAFVVGVVIHVVLSLGFGLMYGVILPTLPPIPGGSIIWGGILMPLFWTWLSYALIGLINPLLGQHVNWLWFLVSQLVYGLAMSTVVARTQKVPARPVRDVVGPAPVEPVGARKQP